MSEKKISMFGIVLVAVSSILVVDTIAAAAIIGPAAIFWWAVLFAAFFVPYGLVTAELGTAYPDEGGICDWVTRAFGEGAGARVAWLYWVNYALWVPAVFYLFSLVFDQIFNLGMSVTEIIVVSIVMSWIKVYITMQDIEDMIWVPNTGSICKAIIMVLLGVSGIYFGLKNGFSNSLSFDAMKPTLDAGMNYLPVIIFNFLGFEVIAGASRALKNPKKDIPIAIMIGGALIITFYLLATIGILSAIPVDQINDATGVIEAFTAMYGGGEIAKNAVLILGLMFLYTLVSNLVTWAIGVNQVVVYAAKEGLLPHGLSKTSEKGMPTTVAIWNGIASSLVLIIYGGIALTAGEDSDVAGLFWDIFTLGAVAFLASYIMLFPSFLKLRLQDSQTARPYVVPGGKLMLFYCGIVPTLIIIAAITFFFYVPGVEFDAVFFQRVGGGVFAVLVLGELIIRMSKSVAEVHPDYIEIEHGVSGETVHTDMQDKKGEEGDSHDKAAE